MEAMKDNQTTNQPQQPLPPSPNPYYPEEDQIDLKGLVLNAWNTRGVWVISMVGVSVLFWGWWSIKQMNAIVPLTYSLPIQLNFEGVNRGTYPNGSPFSRTDLLAPNIIEFVSSKVISPPVISPSNGNEFLLLCSQNNSRRPNQA